MASSAECTPCATHQPRTVSRASTPLLCSLRASLIWSHELSAVVHQMIGTSWSLHVWLPIWFRVSDSRYGRDLTSLLINPSMASMSLYCPRLLFAAACPRLLVVRCALRRLLFLLFGASMLGSSGSPLSLPVMSLLASLFPLLATEAPFLRTRFPGLVAAEAPWSIPLATEAPSGLSVV